MDLQAGGVSWELGAESTSLLSQALETFTVPCNLRLAEVTQFKSLKAQAVQEQEAFWAMYNSVNSLGLPFLIFTGFQLEFNNCLWSRLNESLFYFWWHFHS